MMTRVLFVDDEQRVLDGLRRQLRGLRDEWEMEFCGSGAEALALMNEAPVDVVVSDMKMPGMNGAELLTRVSHEHPETVRIVLSGHADREAILKSVGPAHQYLAKPCEPEVVRATISRACALRRILRDENLKTLVSKIDALPSLPSLYLEITSALQDENTSLAAIGKLIGMDIGMSAQVLKVVNSAFFGIKREVADVTTAISYLGLDTIKALVLSAGVFKQFEGQELELFSLEGLWSHSQRTAHLARALAKAEGFEKEQIDQTFVSGMMHDVGKLVLIAGVPELYQQVLHRTEQGGTTSEAEREILGANHGELGGYLMGLWGLPDPVVEGVAYHVSPGSFPVDEISQITIVHAADAFAGHPWEQGLDLASHPLDEDYLTRIGALDRVPEWGQVCAAVVES